MGKNVIGGDAHKKMDSENRCREIIYSEPDTGPVCLFHVPVSGFFESDVNPSKKISIKTLVFEKEAF